MCRQNITIKSLEYFHRLLNENNPNLSNEIQLIQDNQDYEAERDLVEQHDIPYNDIMILRYNAVRHQVLNRPLTIRNL